MVSNGDDDAAMGQATAAFFPPARRQITVNRRPAVRYSLIGFEVYGPSLSPSYSSLCFFLSRKMMTALMNGTRVDCCDRLERKTPSNFIGFFFLTATSDPLPRTRTRPFHYSELKDNRIIEIIVKKEKVMVILTPVPVRDSKKRQRFRNFLGRSLLQRR